MATTTTNYGFDIPQSTDLVKDGATAIATLGQDIDTAMNTALGTKKAGMVLLNTTSFSGVSSFSLAADTFTTTYENYKILLTVSGTSADSGINIRLRAAGVDTTSNNYFYANMAFRSNNTANNYAEASTSAIAIGQTESNFSANANYYYDIDISQPKLAVNTKVITK